jgi:hypothetical protein
MRKRKTFLSSFCRVRKKLHLRVWVFVETQVSKLARVGLIENVLLCLQTRELERDDVIYRVSQNVVNNFDILFQIKYIVHVFKA